MSLIFIASFELPTAGAIYTYKTATTMHQLCNNSCAMKNNMDENTYIAIFPSKNFQFIGNLLPKLGNLSAMIFLEMEGKNYGNTSCGVFKQGVQN